MNIYWYEAKSEYNLSVKPEYFIIKPIYIKLNRHLKELSMKKIII